MVFKMLWYREVISDPNSGTPDLVPVIFDCEMGFDNAIHYVEKGHFWSKAEKKVLKSDVPISDYIMGKGEPLTLLMQETWEGKLVPLVTKDRKILKGITPILDRFTREKNEEIEMLKDSLESLQTYYSQQLLSYHEHYQRMYATFDSVIPVFLKIMHQRFDTIRQFVRKDFSEHDFEILLSRIARDIELDIQDEYKQDLLDIKAAKSVTPFAGGASPALPAPRAQKSPRKKPANKPDPERPPNPFASNAPKELPPMLPGMAALASAGPNPPPSSAAAAASPPPEKKEQKASGQNFSDLVDAINSGEINWESPDE